MIITLSPMRHDDRITIHRMATILTINGVAYDVADPDLACPWILGVPFQNDGIWHVTVILPHGASAPSEARFPELITLVGDGPITLPQVDADPADETTEG